MAEVPIRLIEDEIKSGLRNERDRLDDALFNREFYKVDFSRFPPRAPGTSYDEARLTRTTPFMNRVVKLLTGNLYRSGPQRILTDHPEASEWLTAMYKANAMDALWQSADRWACIGDTALLQVVPTADADRPVKVQLWDRSQFCVWTDPDDPRIPVAVAILDVYNEQRRLRLWTDDRIQTWMTDTWNKGEPNAPTAYYFVGEKPNVLGCMPFASVHFEFPDSEFETEGPGTNFRAANDCMNFALTEGFDCVRYNMRAVLVLKNVRAGWRPPSPIKPGDIWDLPAQGDAAEDDPKQEAEYLQSDVAFVAAGWDDISSFVDLTLQMVGVPPGTIRMDASAVASGIARVAEHIPLIQWAEGRQRAFGYYEDSLAKLVLKIGAAHLLRNAGRMQGLSVTAKQLDAAARDFGMRLRWPDMYPDLPGEDRDRSDQWRLDNRLGSKTSILMRREKLTR